MSICCIEGCAGPKDEKEIYFEFPTSRLLRKRWLDAMKTAKVPPDSRVCCRHFAPHDYELVRGKIRLRSKVVPTIFDGEVAKDDTETSQESTETAESSSTIIDNKNKTEKLKSNHDHNEKSYNDAEKSDNDVEKSHNDVGRSDNDVEKSCSDVEKSHNDVEKPHNDVEKSHNGDENSHNDVENSHNDVEKPCNDIEKPDKDNVHNEKEKETDKADTNKENSTGNNEKENSTGNNEKENSTGNNEKENSTGNNEKENINNRKENEESQNNRKRNNADNVSEKEKRSRKTRFKVTPKRVVKPPPDLSEDSSNSSDNREESSQPDSSKEDIEGILTHYYIENKKTERQVAAMADAIQAQCNEVQCSEPPPTAPVFIELSVGQEAGQIPSNDCLMVLESVQCEVDPELLLATRGDDDCEKYEIDDDDDPDDKKQDPISLLTSSDEDDVIIEEPKIDTVEVSSADTDEDDIPLVKLVKPPSKTGQHRFSKSKANIITKLLWGGSDFYCAKCRFTTLSASEYTKHMHSHSKVMQLCQDCGFTTSSKVQLSRHKQKHKNEKRFKCALCNYSAKHNMSLMYHMKTHKSIRNIEMAVCNIYKNKVSGRKKSLSKRHSCGDCDYTTDRVSDLKRHRVRRHRDYEGDDEDYAP